MVNNASNVDRSESDYSFDEAKSVYPDAFSIVKIPSHPRLAANNFGSAHCDAYCSESVDLDAPCTKNIRVIRQVNEHGYTPVMVCNDRNQMIGVSLNLDDKWYTLVVFDSECNILNSVPLFQKDASGSFAGGYFFLDNNNDTVVISTTTLSSYNTRNVASSGNNKTENTIQRNWVSSDLTGMWEGLEGNVIYSAMPVWTHGENLYWVLFAGKFNLDLEVPYTPGNSPCAMAVVKIEENPSNPGEWITTMYDCIPLDDQWNNNTFAVDDTGAYFVTNAVDNTTGNLENAACGYLHKMSFDESNKKIRKVWSVGHESCKKMKDGQKNLGSGTTPTLMDDGNNRLVAITDNAEPRMNVCVYNRDDGSLVSKTPVFPKGRSANDASLIGVGSTVFVENNYGHLANYPCSQLRDPNSKRPPIEPGMSRIEVQTSPKPSAQVMWTDSKTSFLAMSMLARKKGVIYAHTADWSGAEGTTEGAMYYISAIDAYNGKNIWNAELGRGVRFCHDYGGVYFNRDGNLFVGTANYICSVQKSA